MPDHCFVKVDVSIELIPPGTSKPSMIWIWECKDYAGSVPVHDKEEFHAKLEQIGSDNTKGTMVTRGRYQESTIEYAIAKGIGPTRIVDGNKIRLEPRAGLYDRVAISSIVRRILSHEIKDIISLDSSNISSLEVSDRYFFGVSFTQRESCSGLLDALIAQQLLELRKQFPWLASSGH